MFSLISNKTYTYTQTGMHTHIHACTHTSPHTHSHSHLNTQTQYLCMETGPSGFLMFTRRQLKTSSAEDWCPPLIRPPAQSRSRGWFSSSVTVSITSLCSVCLPAASRALDLPPSNEMPWLLRLPNTAGFPPQKNCVTGHDTNTTAVLCCPWWLRMGHCYEKFGRISVRTFVGTTWAKDVKMCNCPV